MRAGTGEVFTSMGTVVSLRADGDTDVIARSAAVAASVFDRWDRRCSLFRTDSELSRVARGELALTKAGTELRNAYALAVAWRARTGGAFTPHRADGVIDLNGVVKAVAIAEAGEALRAMGVAGWGIDAGGDVLVSGPRSDGSPWLVGIVDPWRATACSRRSRSEPTAGPSRPRASPNAATTSGRRPTERTRCSSR